MTTMRRVRVAVAVALLLLACDESGPSNVAPTATFTAQCTALGCAFTNGSTDPDGTLEAYAWDFGDESTGATTRDAAHTYAGAGRFTVTLTVTDDDGDSTVATTTVEVEASPNPGSLAVSFSVSCVELECEFTNLSATSSAAQFRWYFGDNSEPATTRDASHRYLVEGQYTVALGVIDFGATGSTTQTVSVALRNFPPVADFVYTCTELACEFTDRSTDETGVVELYAWNFGDGQVSTATNPSHAFTSAGTYTVELTVTDERGATGTASRQFTLPATGWPTADLVANCYYSSCSFSTVPTGGTIVTWQWSFGDGATSTEATPSHFYVNPGTYTVQVNFADAQGGTGMSSREVTVPVQGLVAAFTVSCDGTTCAFTNQSTGPIVGVTWDFGDGSTSGDWNPWHQYDVSGTTTFTVHLTVYDWDLFSDSTSLDITISP